MIVYKLDISNKEAVFAWLDRIRKGSDDARPLWKAMAKQIPVFTNYEFDPNRDNHKLWPKLKDSTLAQKERKGFPSGIGFQTGTLREPAGAQAKRELKPKYMLWLLNAEMTRTKGGKWKYGEVFHWGKKDGSQPARPIFKYTRFRVSSFLKLDAKNFKNGVTHASFTYAWLKKMLEK